MAGPPPLPYMCEDPQAYGKLYIMLSQHYATHMRIGVLEAEGQNSDLLCKLSPSHIYREKSPLYKCVPLQKAIIAKLHLLLLKLQHAITNTHSGLDLNAMLLDNPLLPETTSEQLYMAKLFKVGILALQEHFLEPRQLPQDHPSSDINNVTTSFSELSSKMK